VLRSRHARHDPNAAPEDLACFENPAQNRQFAQLFGDLAHLAHGAPAQIRARRAVALDAREPERPMKLALLHAKQERAQRGLVLRLPPNDLADLAVDLASFDELAHAPAHGLLLAVLSLGRVP